MNIIKSIWMLLLTCCILYAGLGCYEKIEDETGDISLARKFFYQESRSRMVNWIENEMPSEVRASYLSACSIQELKQSELGEAIPIWSFLDDDNGWQVKFSSEKTVKEQVGFENIYLFPIIADGKIVADYHVSVQNGKVTGEDCSLDKQSYYAYAVAEANSLDINQCYLVYAPGGTMFLFNISDGQEICSQELRKKSNPDLTMNKENAEVFKLRIAKFNAANASENAAGDKAVDSNAPMGKAPPFIKTK